MARSVRSHDRSAAVLWRCSPEMKQTAKAQAEARGTSLSRLLDEAVLAVLDLDDDERERLRLDPGYKGRKVAS